MNPFSKIRLLRKALRVYAGEHVLQRVERDGEAALKLTGEVVEGTVMFTGISRFLPALGSIEASVQARLVGEYFSVLESATGKHGGLFDGPIGEEAISYWQGSSHATRACDCAVEVVGSLAEAAKLEGPGILPKIGIHSGRLYVGNVGCESRMRFTVAGDAVNLSSRLASFASSRDAHIVITEHTKKLLMSSHRTQEMEAVNVKGIEKPVMLYAINTV
jgi:adenylate cyclase